MDNLSAGFKDIVVYTSMTSWFDGYLLSIEENIWKMLTRSCWSPPKDREMQMSVYPNKKLRLKNSPTPQNVIKLKPSWVLNVSTILPSLLTFNMQTNLGSGTTYKRRQAELCYTSSRLLQFVQNKSSY